MALQRLLPIVEDGKETNILGLLDLGAIQYFDGTELNWTFTTAGGPVVQPLEKWTPTPSLIRDQNDWFMVAVFTHQQVLDKAYMGFPVFTPMDDVLPAAQWSSGSGLANVLRYYNGPILDGLEEENGFATGLTNVLAAPVNTVLPVVSGTATVGNLQTSTQGTWTEGIAYRYQWQRNIAAVWTDEASATGLTFTPSVAGTYRIRVTAYNQLGSTIAYSADRVIA